MQDVVDRRLHHPKCGQRGGAWPTISAAAIRPRRCAPCGRRGRSGRPPHAGGFHWRWRGLRASLMILLGLLATAMSQANCIFNLYCPTSMWGQLTRIPTGMQLNLTRFDLTQPRGRLIAGLDYFGTTTPFCGSSFFRMRTGLAMSWCAPTSLRQQHWLWKVAGIKTVTICAAALMVASTCLRSTPARSSASSWSTSPPPRATCPAPNMRGVRELFDTIETRRSCTVSRARDRAGIMSVFYMHSSAVASRSARR